MGWKDEIERMRAAEDNPVPAQWLDAIESSISEVEQEYHDFRAGSETRLSEYETKLAEREAEVSRLKATNFDLLMSSGAGSGGDDGKENDSRDDEPRITGIDSLFG